MKSVLVTGGSGFIGGHLVGALVAAGYQVTVLTRNMQKTVAKLPGAVRVISSLDSLDAVPDVLVNLAGEPLAARRWSPELKLLIRSSRIGFTDALFAFFEQRGEFPGRVISGSAIGYYGDCGDKLIDERKPAGTDFAAQLCKGWELSARQFERRGSSLCLVRTGIVLGGEGGALRQMLPAFRMGLGGPMGSGEQYMSWIHIDDMVGLILFLINHPVVTGPVNAVAPHPVTNNQFAFALAQTLHRPAWFAVPTLVLKLLFGEMASTLLLASQRVLPTQALGCGFEFRYPQLGDALKNVFAK